MELLDRRLCAGTKITVRAHLVTGRVQLGLQQNDTCVLGAPAQYRRGGGCIRRCDATKGCLRLRQVGLAIVKSIQTTIDSSRDRLNGS